MGPLLDRANLVVQYFSELAKFGAPEVDGPVEREALFMLDGVGRLQAGVLMVRRAFREERTKIGTVLFDWQTPIYGEIFSDLMWLRRNRLQGLVLARRLLAFRRAHPSTPIHLLAFSGGAGIALFACESLAGRRLIDTLVLSCPAVSPTYNLVPALRAVQRCYAWISHRDSVLLGLGTRLFGTTDRRFTAAAGKLGFEVPPGLSDAEIEAYGRVGEIHWTPALRKLGHSGGHIGWASVTLLREHLPAMLAGTPRLPVQAVRMSDAVVAAEAAP